MTTTTTTCPASSVKGDCGCAIYNCVSDAAGTFSYSLQSTSGQSYGCLYNDWWPGPCDEGALTVWPMVDPAEIDCGDARSFFVDSIRAPIAQGPYQTTTAAPVLSSVAWLSTGSLCPSSCISGLFGLARTAVSGFFPRWYPPATGTLDPDTGKIGAPYHQLYHSPHQAKCENPCGSGGWMVPASEYGERIHAGLTPAPCTYVWTGKWTLIEYYHTVDGSGVYGDECSSAGGTCIPPAVPDYPPPNGTIGYGGCCKAGFYTTTTSTTTTTTTTSSTTTTTTSTTTTSTTTLPP